MNNKTNLRFGELEPKQLEKKEIRIKLNLLGELRPLIKRKLKN